MDQLLPSDKLVCTRAYILWLWIQSDTRHLITKEMEGEKKNKSRVWNYSFPKLKEDSAIIRTAP